MSFKRDKGLQITSRYKLFIDNTLFGATVLK